MNSMTYLNQHRVFQDQFGRQKRKLRISVTDRCNFKCVYCMPEHPEWMKKHELLSFDELFVFCQFMVQQGIEQIRITGGEPLMRHGVVHFIAQLQQLKSIGLKRISMTSNGHYLVKYAAPLKQAGLDDLNISLDSLDAAQFKVLTQKEINSVLAGIEAAAQAGLSIKINTVLMKGINEDQIIPLVKWAHNNQFEPRFIEFMPLDGDQKWSSDAVVTEQEILNALSKEFAVHIQHGQGSNPARNYNINGKSVGIISTISNSFCGTCDRLRLNAQGEFFNCLFAQNGLKLKSEIQHLTEAFLENGLTQHLYTQSIDLAHAWQTQSDVMQAQLELQDQLANYIWHKAQGYDAIQKTLKQEHSTQPSHARKISMHMIGG
ncbi:GTP 3',8-cyclase MoaA [Acinetobacter gandensis]|uniref:GTP 3',8-cyclase n=1 Tax=Acinetobacter gandensis TaxID=1443941 RepID=A0A1A7RGT1_9GAMM|nr:GTP 3',8-cyclase MoaA [Acinetobacter gandensis]KAB0627297.1 GTP 3',8-cyclase MoaA [Acinetobacter gandensis]OBX29852.1 cyclic pyranopterin phosphate synthase MoaA [Acinetobacter gandensis]